MFLFNSSLPETTLSGANTSAPGGVGGVFATRSLFRKHSRRPESEYASPRRNRPASHSYIPTSKQTQFHSQTRSPTRVDSVTCELPKTIYQTHQRSLVSAQPGPNLVSESTHSSRPSVSYPLPYTSTKEQEALLFSTGAEFRVVISNKTPEKSLAPSSQRQSTSGPSSSPSPCSFISPLPYVPSTLGTSESNCSLTALPPTPNPNPCENSEAELIPPLPTLGSAIQIVEPTWRTKLSSHPSSNSSSHAESTLVAAGFADSPFRSLKEDRSWFPSPPSFTQPNSTSISPIAHSFTPRKSLDSAGIGLRSSSSLNINPTPRLSFDGLLSFSGSNNRRNRTVRIVNDDEQLLDTPWSMIERPDMFATSGVDPSPFDLGSNGREESKCGKDIARRGSKINIPIIKAWGSKFTRLGSDERGKSNKDKNKCKGKENSNSFGAGFHLSLPRGLDIPLRRSSVPLGGTIDARNISHPIIIIDKEKDYQAQNYDGSFPLSGHSASPASTIPIAPALSRPSSHSHRSSRSTSPRIPPPRHPLSSNIDPASSLAPTHSTSDRNASFLGISQTPGERMLPALDDSSMIDTVETPTAYPHTPERTNEREENHNSVQSGHLTTTTSTSFTSAIHNYTLTHREHAFPPAAPSKSLRSKERPLPLCVQNRTSNDGHEYESELELQSDSSDTVVTREQSMSELREAFTRMRNLSGPGSGEAEDSSCFSFSIPTSGRESIASCLPPSPARNLERSPDLERLDQTLLSLLQDIHETLSTDPKTTASLTRLGNEDQYPLTLRKSDSAFLTAPPPSRSISESTSILSLTELKTNENEKSDTKDGDNEYLAPGSSAHQLRSINSVYSDSNEKEFRVGEEKKKKIGRSRSATTFSVASTCEDMIAQTERSQGTGWWSNSSEKIGDNISSIAQIGSKELDRSILPIVPAQSTEHETESTVSGSSGNTNFHLDCLEKAARSVTRPRTSTYAPPNESSQSKQSCRREENQGTRPRRRSIFHGPRPSFVVENVWQVVDNEASTEKTTHGKAEKEDRFEFSQSETKTPIENSSVMSCTSFKSETNNSRPLMVNHNIATATSSMAVKMDALAGDENKDETPTRARPKTMGADTVRTLFDLAHDSPLRSRPMKSTQRGSSLSPSQQKKIYSTNTHGSSYSSPNRYDTPTKRAPSSLAIASSTCDPEIDATISALKAKHSLEVDALLAALSGSVSEARDLHSELGRVTQEWSETQRERDGLRIALREAQRRLESEVAGKTGSVRGSVGANVRKSKIGLNIAGVDLAVNGRGGVANEFGRIKRS